MTVVAATTSPGRITSPLRGRFKFTGHVQPYPFEDLQLIVLSYAERLGVKLEWDAAEVIARASRYTPRDAIRLFDGVRDYADGVDQDVIDLETARQGLEFQEVDEWGLDDRDRRVLRCVADEFVGGPIGLAPLGSALGMDPSELTKDVEPYLVQAGLLRLTSRGRTATKDTYVVLGMRIPPLINGLLR